MKTVFIRFVGICLWASLAGCGLDIVVDTQIEERARLISPDNKVEAIIEFAGGGGRVSSGITVYLAPAGKELEDENDREEFRYIVLTPIKDDAVGIAAMWKSSNLLEISYDTKRESFWKKAGFIFEDIEYRIVEKNVAKSSARVDR